MQDLTFIKVAKFFLENPYKEFYLREIAKKLKLSPFAINKYCNILIKERLIIEIRKANLRYFTPNLSSLFYKQLKIALNIKNIQNSGVLESLQQNVPNISSIVLYGSMAKGENDEKSDIDLLIIGKESKVMRKFSDLLHGSIQYSFFSWSEWNKKAKEDNPFYFEVISYGIVLFGELPVVRWK